MKEKKRMICFLMALIIVLGIIPDMCITAHAASVPFIEPDSDSFFSKLIDKLSSIKDQAIQFFSPSDKNRETEATVPSASTGNDPASIMEEAPTPVVQSEENASLSPVLSVTEKIDRLQPIMEGKYWNAGKSAKELIDAVDKGDLTVQGLGLTSIGCKSSSKKGTPPCTSNFFQFGNESEGNQCNGFAKFIAYYLFGSQGDVSKWKVYSGESVFSVPIEPGDRVGDKGHQAIVWKVENGIVYVVECWGSYRENRHDGCLINFGYYNGSSTYKTEDALKRYLSTAHQGSIDKAPSNETKLGSKTPSLSISGQNVPGTLEVGGNFGIRGTVSTDCGIITQIHGAIKDASGAEVQSCDFFPNTSSDDLRYSVNKKLVFGTLPAGNYTYYVSAHVKNGTKETDRVLIEQLFRIEDPSSSMIMPTQAPEQTTEPPVVEISPILSISGENYPSVLEQGSNFGIRGTVAVSCGVITEVQGKVLDSSGAVVMSTAYYPNTATHDLRYSINNDLAFGTLPTGSYTYIVSAHAQNGSKEADKTLIDASFRVESLSKTSDEPTQPPAQAIEPPVADETPSISISGQNYPSVLEQGSNFGIRGTVSASCGVITEVQGMVLDSSGSVVISAVYYPNEADHDLRYSINNDLVFGTLPVGNYTYYVSAKAANGSQTANTALINAPFTVAAAAAPSDSPEPELDSIGRNMTVNVGQGSTLRFCSTVSVADSYEIGSIPNNAVVWVYGTTRQKYEDRIWAKISYNGTDGWVNYKWLS